MPHTLQSEGRPDSDWSYTSDGGGLSLRAEIWDPQELTRLQEKAEQIYGPIDRDISNIINSKASIKDKHLLIRDLQIKYNLFDMEGSHHTNTPNTYFYDMKPEDKLTMLRAEFAKKQQ